MTYRRALNPNMLTVGELARVLSLKPDTIRKSRSAVPNHPLFSKAFKPGRGENSPLHWWRSDVEEYLASVGRRADWSVLGNGAVAEGPAHAPAPLPALDAMSILLALADAAEGVRRSASRSGSEGEGRRVHR